MIYTVSMVIDTTESTGIRGVSFFGSRCEPAVHGGQKLLVDVGDPITQEQCEKNIKAKDLDEAAMLSLVVMLRHMRALQLVMETKDEEVLPPGTE